MHIANKADFWNVRYLSEHLPKNFFNSIIDFFTFRASYRGSGYKTVNARRDRKAFWNLMPKELKDCVTLNQDNYISHFIQKVRF